VVLRKLVQHSRDENILIPGQGTQDFGKQPPALSKSDLLFCAQQMEWINFDPAILYLH
jgi:hypothetical protein